MAFPRKKMKRLPWRVGPPTSEELARQKAAQKETPPPLKRPTIGDVMITKGEQ